MKCSMFSLAMLALTSSVLGGEPTSSQERLLSHDVYFSLREKSTKNAEMLIAACKKYLSGHPGTVWFAVGPLAPELAREVNDLDFDVALHIVFKDKASHDAYQVSEQHVKFIEQNQQLWGKVRVFDSYVAAYDHGAVATP